MNPRVRRLSALEAKMPNLDPTSVVFIVGFGPNWNPTTARLSGPESEPVERLSDETVNAFKERVAIIARANQLDPEHCALVFLMDSRYES